MLRMIRSSVTPFVAFLAVTATMSSSPASQAETPRVVDRNGRTIGTLLATNTVLIESRKNYFAVKFKEPGFDTFTEIDQSVIVTAYFLSDDCTGPMYYSDQADGKWKRNLTPSVYDIPTTGIAIGVTPSQTDSNYYSKIDFYYPDGKPSTVTVKSKMIVGESATPTKCFDVTPATDVFWSVKKITFEATPPFRLK